MVLMIGATRVKQQLILQHVRDLFAASPSASTLEQLRAFLASVVAEEVDWEAKADGSGRGRLTADEVRDTVCAFANSADDGYLLVGVQRDASGAWRSAGLARPPADDLTVWLDQAIDGVSPRPSAVIRPFRGEQGRGAAVVIPAVEEPPAITSGGRVLARQNGRSVPVSTHAALRSLFESGRAAQEATAQAARQAAERALEFPPPGVPVPVFSVAIAPIAERRALWGRAMAEGFGARIEDTFRRHFDNSSGFYGVGARVSATQLVAWLRANDGTSLTVESSGALAAARWDYAIGPEQGVNQAVGVGDLAALWNGLGAVAEQLDCAGRTCVAIRAIHRDGTAAVARTTARPRPTAADIEAVCRELERAIGRPRWEPTTAS